MSKVIESFAIKEVVDMKEGKHELKNVEVYHKGRIYHIYDDYDISKYNFDF